MIKHLLKADLRDLLSRRKQSYKQVFGGFHGKRVLADLARFCRATEATFDPDPRLSAYLDGRREVWLRIQQQLNLTDEEIYKLNDVYDEE